MQSRMYKQMFVVPWRARVGLSIALRTTSTERGPSTSLAIKEVRIAALPTNLHVVKPHQSVTHMCVHQTLPTSPCLSICSAHRGVARGAHAIAKTTMTAVTKKESAPRRHVSRDGFTGTMHTKYIVRTILLRRHVKGHWRMNRSAALALATAQHINAPRISLSKRMPRTCAAEMTSVPMQTSMAVVMEQVPANGLLVQLATSGPMIMISHYALARSAP